MAINLHPIQQFRRRLSLVDGRAAIATRDASQAREWFSRDLMLSLSTRRIAIWCLCARNALSMALSKLWRAWVEGAHVRRSV